MSTVNNVQSAPIIGWQDNSANLSSTFSSDFSLKADKLKSAFAGLESLAADAKKGEPVSAETLLALVAKIIALTHEARVDAQKMNIELSKASMTASISIADKKKLDADKEAIIGIALDSFNILLTSFSAVSSAKPVKVKEKHVVNMFGEGNGSAAKTEKSVLMKEKNLITGEKKLHLEADVPVQVKDKTHKNNKEIEKVKELTNNKKVENSKDTGESKLSQLTAKEHNKIAARLQDSKTSKNSTIVQLSGMVRDAGSEVNKIQNAANVSDQEKANAEKEFTQKVGESQNQLLQSIIEMQKASNDLLDSIEKILSQGNR